MPTVTVYTAARMKQIEDNAIVNAEILNGNLIFTKHNGEVIDAGPVLVLTAPDDSKYRLVVDNTGNLSTEPI